MKFRGSSGGKRRSLADDLALILLFLEGDKIGVRMRRLFFFFGLFLSFSFTAGTAAETYPSGFSSLSCSKSDRNPLKCLVCSIYFEARGEDRSGQVDAGRVMITRVLDARFPDTMCGVVWQKGQFSWTKDGKTDVIPGGEVLADVVEAAKEAVNQGPNQYVSYYAHYIRPYWYRECKRRIRRGAHIYCDKGFQRESDSLLVRDILMHLDSRDIPIPEPRPVGPYDEIPTPVARPNVEMEDFEQHLPALDPLGREIPPALREAGE